MRFLILLLLLVCPLCAEEWTGSTSGDFSAEISVHPTHLNAYQDLRVTLRLRYPSGYTPSLEALRANLEQPSVWGEPQFNVREEQSSASAVDGDGTVTRELTYTVEPWAVGTLYLSFGMIQWEAERGGEVPVRLLTPSFAIEVAVGEISSYGHGELQPLMPLYSDSSLHLSQSNRRALIDDRVKSDASAQETLKRYRERQLPWRILYALAALGAGYYVLRRWVQRWTAGWRKMRSLPKDPRERALEALRDLHERDLPSQGLFDPYYSQLTGIVRSYIEEAFGIRAPEQTTREFLQELRYAPEFSSETKEDLEAFLDSADLVKFARHVPQLADCQNAEQSAVRFIRTSH
ncbi:MAG: hypothetical protein KDK78_05885 [Chlamydiia bacterium]|nr:hypothetical protein [Chlamydiia bacterium]